MNKYEGKIVELDSGAFVHGACLTETMQLGGPEENWATPSPEDVCVVCFIEFGQEEDRP